MADELQTYPASVKDVHTDLTDAVFNVLRQAKVEFDLAEMAEGARTHTPTTDMNKRVLHYHSRRRYEEIVRTRVTDMHKICLAAGIDITPLLRDAGLPDPLKFPWDA